MTDLQAYTGASAGFALGIAYVTKRVGPIEIMIRVLVYLRAVGFVLRLGWIAGWREVRSRWESCVREAGLL